MLAEEVRREDWHNLKFSLIQSTPVVFGRRETLSKADQEDLRRRRCSSTIKLLHYVTYLIVLEQLLLGAAAEKSLVTILPNASQGEVN